MEKPARNYWSELRRTLPARRFRNWSVLKHDLGPSFIVVGVYDDRIEVTSDGINYPRRIYKSGIEKIAQVWAGYNARTTPRKDLRDISQNST